MVPALAASSAPAPRPSTSPRAVANARNDGAPRGRSSTAGNRAGAFGEALDGAQGNSVNDRGTTRAEGERRDPADGARETAARREESDAQTENAKSKDKESSDGIAPPIVAPVLRLTETNREPSGTPHDDGKPTRVDNAPDASALDLQQAAAANATQNQQAMAGTLVDAPAATDAGRKGASQAAIATAADGPTKAERRAAAELAEAASAFTSKQPPADESSPSADAPADANARPQNAPSITSRDQSTPTAPPKGSGRDGVEPIGSAGTSAADRAAARKRAAELLNGSVSATDKTPATMAQADTSKQFTTIPHEEPGSAPGVSSARQAGAATERPTVQAGQLGTSDTVVTTSADPSRSHGDPSPGRQHQPAFDDRRMRDALAAASPARGHDVAQPLAAAVESQASFARLVDGPQAPSGAVPSPGAALATVDEQVIRGIQLQMRDGGGEARIHLRPEHLGDVVVEMRVERDGVVATLRADTPAVRGWLATHQDDLRAGLADVGLHLERLTVSDREAPQDQRRDPAQDEAPRRRRREQPAASGRFEIDA
jgi:flagellar hook-length control protein FliK